jgi:hypothetical protein
MRTFACLLLLPLTLAACDRGQPVREAAPHVASTASATLADATLQASGIALADLNPAVASAYGIASDQSGLLLLVTVRNAAGDAVATEDLRLKASATPLGEGPRTLELRPIRTGALTDYVGVLQIAPPASVQFRVDATRAGARAQMAFGAELQRR